MDVKAFTQDPDVVVAVEAAKALNKTYSDLRDSQNHQYIDVVMQGGGMLGLALVGYTYVLESVGLRFLGIGGTSAGSIVAILLASVGTPPDAKSEKIIPILANTDFSSFVDGGWLAKEEIKLFLEGKLSSPPAQAAAVAAVYAEIRKTLGLNPGNVFKKWMSDQLQAAGVNTVADMEARQSSVPVLTNKVTGESVTDVSRLAVVASDVTTQTKSDFPRMAPLYWQDPSKVSPAEFARASMSIPYFFEPYQVSVPQGAPAVKLWDDLASYDATLPTTVDFVDGGLMSNFPINLFHLPGVPSAPTFGIKLGKDRTAAQIATPLELGGAILNASRHCLDFDFLTSHPDYSKLIGDIDTGNANWLDFSMPDATKIDLFRRGAQTALDFLKSFDWEAYKKIRASLEEAYRSTPRSTPGLEARPVGAAIGAP